MGAECMKLDEAGAFDFAKEFASSFSARSD